MTEKEQTGKAPDYRVVQADTDSDGKPRYTNVGGIWLDTMTFGMGALKFAVRENKTEGDSQPDYELVLDGKRVGAMWKSKQDAKTFASLKLGDARFLVFKNEPKPKPAKKGAL